jgi:hypothetical protein
MEENRDIPIYSLKMMWEFIFVAELIGFIILPAFCFRYLSLSVFTVLPLLSFAVTIIAWFRLFGQIKRSYKIFRRFPKRPHRRSAMLAIFAALAAGGLILGHAVEFLIGEIRTNFSNIVPVIIGFLVTFLLWKMYPALVKSYAARKRLRERRLRTIRSENNDVGYGTP